MRAERAMQSCVCPRDDGASIAGRRELAKSSGPPAPRMPFTRTLPLRWLAVASRGLLLLPVPSERLPVASRGFPSLTVASRVFPYAFPLVITANLSVDPWCHCLRPLVPLVSLRVFC